MYMEREKDKACYLSVFAYYVNTECTHAATFLPLELCVTDRCTASDALPISLKRAKTRCVSRGESSFFCLGQSAKTKQET